MTKKKPAKRIASNGPRLPGQPTKKTVKARAKARKQDVPVVSAEDVQTVLNEPFVMVNVTGLEQWVDDNVDVVGQQAVEYKPGDSFEIIGPDGPGHAQPVDVPIQVTPAFDVPAVTRRELRLNPPNISPKQQRAKRRLEDGTGWRCLNCYRVLSPKLSGCPFCSTRKARP